MQVQKENVNNKILIVGDLHAEWYRLNSLAAKHRPEIILQVGDLGWWPREHGKTGVTDMRHKFNQYTLKTAGAKLYFCPGNHEDWWDLLKYTEPTELFSNVIYMPRGSTLTLPDGRVILFMGGGVSIDKQERVLGYDWFPEETISYADFEKVPEGIHVDIVVSHTCPGYFKTELDIGNWKAKDNWWSAKYRDPSCDALSQLLERFNPSLWFFGHFHKYRTAMYRNTRWYCLNKVAEAGWWMFLPN
jgi:Icc-related predicted phosphoesterase